MGKAAVLNVYPKAKASKDGRWTYIYSGEKLLGAGITPAKAWAQSRERIG